MKTLVHEDEASQDDDVFAWIVIVSIIGGASLAFYGSLLW
jgi:hypothetical protein